MRDKLTIKQKLIHFLCAPILFFVSFYCFFYIAYFFKRELPITEENVLGATAIAIGASISHCFIRHQALEVIRRNIKEV